ncbi:MAG: type II toxin-antitoxin system VapC family toxin [Schumannella sp.]
MLLDTNALYWILKGDPRLGPSAREAVERAPSLLVSDISLLEIAIKVSVGKLPAVERLPARLTGLGFDRTGITDGALERLQTLPVLHRDPFDRMLIAHALTESLPVLTADAVFRQYGVRVVDASR